MEYAEALWNEALGYNRVYHEYALKGIFIEGLPEFIRHSIRSYWGSQKNDKLHDLVSHVTLLTKLQRGSPNTKTPRHHDKMANRCENQGQRGRIFNIITLTSSFSKKSSRKSSRKNKPSSWSPPHTMPIWHQPTQHTQQSFSLPSSTTTNDHAPFCCSV